MSKIELIALTSMGKSGIILVVIIGWVSSAETWSGFRRKISPFVTEASGVNTPRGDPRPGPRMKEVDRTK